MADQRQWNACHGDGLGDASHVEQGLTGPNGSDASRQNGSEGILALDGHPVTLMKKDEVETDQHHTSRKTQLFPDDGIDEIGFGDGDAFRVTLAKSCTPNATGEHA